MKKKEKQLADISMILLENIIQKVFKTITGHINTLLYPQLRPKYLEQVF